MREPAGTGGMSASTTLPVVIVLNMFHAITSMPASMVAAIDGALQIDFGDIELHATPSPAAPFGAGELDLDPAIPLQTSGWGNYDFYGDRFLSTPNEPNAISISYYLRDRQERKGRPHVMTDEPPELKGKQFQRFGPVWRLAHLAFAISVIVLALATFSARPMKRLPSAPAS
mgnify:CR=1 FL=1